MPAASARAAPPTPSGAAGSQPAGAARTRRPGPVPSGRRRRRWEGLGQGGGAVDEPGLLRWRSLRHAGRLSLQALCEVRRHPLLRAVQDGGRPVQGYGRLHLRDDAGGRRGLAGWRRH